MQAADRKEARPVAVLVSDLHLRMTTPKARAEPDWFEVQARELGRMSEVCNKHNIPLVVAGDVFDSGWQSSGCPPELINFAIAQFKRFKGGVLAVPGQHDLPHHRIEDIERSAYWTLVEAGVMTDLSPDTGGAWEDCDHKVVYHGFPWGVPAKPRTLSWEHTHPGFTHVAVVHEYCWRDSKNRHPDAANTHSCVTMRKKTAGFDVVLCGDNHQHWIDGGKKGVPTILNNGGWIRRNADEKEQPRGFSVLMSDKSVVRHFTPTGSDEWKPAEDLVLGVDPMTNLQSDEFLKGLASAGTEFFDFCASILRHLDKQGVRAAVREIVTKVLAKAKGGA